MNQQVGRSEFGLKMKNFIALNRKQIKLSKALRNWWTILKATRISLGGAHKEK